MIFAKVEKGAVRRVWKKKQRNGAKEEEEEKRKKGKGTKGGRIETRHSIAEPVSGANQFRCIRQECTGHEFANGDKHSRRFSTSASRSNPFERCCV